MTDAAKKRWRYRLRLAKKKGWSRAEAARRYGVSRTRISQVCNELKMDLPRAPTGKRDDNWDATRRYRGWGWTIRRIAQKQGLSDGAVHRRLKVMGVA